MQEITVQYRKPASGKWKTHTLEKRKDGIGNVLVCELNDTIGKRGKVRIHLDSGDVFHHDPRFTLSRSVKIGELAKVS